MKIFHTADFQLNCFHAGKDNTKKYQIGIDLLLEELKYHAPDALVITGDLYEYYNPDEASRHLLAKFLKKASNIVKHVIITAGNHDLQQNGYNYVFDNGVKKPILDAIETTISSLALPNIHYLKDTGYYTFDDVTFAVWSHNDKIHKKIYNPYQLADKPSGVVIDLFHDRIVESKNQFGIEVKGTVSIHDFQGDYFLLGDIHKYQHFLSKGGYCSSSIARDFGEGYYYTGLSKDNYTEHGYNILDTDRKSLTFVEMPPNKMVTYHTINVLEGQNTMTLAVKKGSKVKIKFVYDKFDAKQHNSLVDILTTEYDVLHLEYTVNRSESLIKASNVASDLDSITDSNKLMDFFSQYLSLNKIEGETAEQAKKMFYDYCTKIEQSEKANDIRVISLSASKYRTLGDISIAYDGLTRIDASNGIGKTTITQILPTLLWLKNRTNNAGNTKNKNILTFFNDKSEDDVIVLRGSFIVNEREVSIERVLSRVWKKNKPMHKEPDWEKHISEVTIRTSISVDGLDLGYDEKQCNDYIDSTFGDYESYSNLYELYDENLQSIISMRDEEIVSFILSGLNLGIIDEILEKAKEEEKYWKDTNTILKIDIASHTKSIQDLENANYTLEADKKVLEQKNSNLNSDLESYERLMESHQKLLKPIDKTYTKYSHNIEDALGSAERKILANNTLIESYKNLKGNIDGLEVEKNSLYSANDAIVLDINSLNEKISEATDSITAIKTQIGELNSQIQAKKSAFALDKNSRAEALTIELDKVRGSYRAESNRIKQEIDEKVTALDNKRNSLLAELNANKAEKSKHDAYIASTEKLGKCQYCSKDIATDVQEVFECLKKAKEKSLELSGVISNIEQSISSTDILISSERNRQISSDLLLAIKKEGEELGAKLKALEMESFDELSVSDIREGISNNEKKAGELTSHIQAIKSDVSKLQAQKQANDAKVASITAEIKSLNEKVSKATDIEKENMQISFDIEKIKASIEDISYNSTIEDTILGFRNTIQGLKNDISLNSKSMMDIDYSIKSNIQKADSLKKEIDLFHAQNIKQKTFDIIKKVCSKKELPVFIFRGIAEAINSNIEAMLQNLPFKVFFDTSGAIPTLSFMDFSANFRVRDIRECSGMERTFAILALKTQLIRFSPTKYNLIFIDEITGKLNKQYQGIMADIISSIVMGYNLNIAFIDHTIDDSMFTCNVNNIKLDKGDKYCYLV